MFVKRLAIKIEREMKGTIVNWQQTTNSYFKMFKQRQPNNRESNTNILSRR